MSRVGLYQFGQSMPKMAWWHFLLAARSRLAALAKAFVTQDIFPYCPLFLRCIDSYRDIEDTFFSSYRSGSTP